ncbi:hypothetical protein GM556_08485 [Bombella sp. ESL0378]|uniref:hypothetical protein n=1 Tax=Bombella sp. ESL0378 TaxID=2676442 RepID=UPI0012D90450|nr:hypothetical protein [Bombella sp. ESL0378]MUG05569.1 hypothetical protein [Bombella sp. ESL0378]
MNRLATYIFIIIFVAITVVGIMYEDSNYIFYVKSIWLFIYSLFLLSFLEIDGVIFVVQLLFLFSDEVRVLIALMFVWYFSLRWWKFLLFISPFLCLISIVFSVSYEGHLDIFYVYNVAAFAWLQLGLRKNIDLFFDKVNFPIFSWDRVILFIFVVCIFDYIFFNGKMHYMRVFHLERYC